MNEFKDGEIVVLVIITLAVGFLLGGITTMGSGYKTRQQEEIKAGVAQYNPTNGIVEFKTNLNFERKL